MRVVQRAYILRLRHHGVRTHLPLPSHLLGCASQKGVPAALQAFRPPPPLQGVLVRSGRIRAALLARGPLLHHHLHITTGLMRTRHKHKHPGLGRGTDARGTEAGRNPQVLHPLTPASIDRPDHHPFLLNPAVPLACLLLLLRHLGFFSPLTGDSQHLLIRPGETQSLPLNPLAKPQFLHLVHAHPAPPSVPIQPMGKLVRIMDATMPKWDRNKDKTPQDKMIGQEGVAVLTEVAVGEVPRGGRRRRLL
jgi:hypothetical protein